jgi:hypothetical protein
VTGWAFRDMLTGLVAGRVPVIGPAFQGVILGEFGGRIGLGGAGVTTLTAGLRALAAPFGAIGRAAAGEDVVIGSDIKDVGALITLLSGWPLIQPFRSIAYGVDVARGEFEPTSRLDFIRGLLVGRPSEASR